MNPSPTIEEVWNAGEFATNDSLATRLVEEKTITINASGNVFTLPAQTIEIDLGDEILTDTYRIKARFWYVSSSSSYVTISADKALKGKIQINDTVKTFNFTPSTAGNTLYYDFNSKTVKQQTNSVPNYFSGTWGRIKKIKLTIDESITFTLPANASLVAQGIALYRNALFL